MIFWTHEFTAADGTLWATDTVGYTKVAGGIGDSTVIGNKGRTGATATFRLYQSNGFPPIRDYKTDVILTWADATTVGRTAGIAARLTDDGEVCYYADLSSYSPAGGGGTIGTPHLRLFRRRAGVDTQLGLDVDISGTVSAADLEAGVRLGLRLENTDDGIVSLKVSVDRGAGHVVYINYTDSAGASITIEDGGSVGLVCDSLSSGSDVEYDDHRVMDFADEAADLEYEEGLAIILNGTYLDAEQIEALGIGGIKARQSYALRPEGEIRDLADVNSAALRPGDDIAILFDNTFMASGVIRPVIKGASVPTENIQYEIHGPKLLCQGVVVTEPVTALGSVTFNQDPTDPNYDSGRANKSPGDLLDWLFDNHAEGQDGLRAHKAAPAYGTVAVIPAGLSSGPVIPNITLSGDFAQAVEFVLSYMPGWAWYVDPETKQHTFHNRAASSKVDIDVSDDWIEEEIEVHPELNKTAVLIRGGEPEIEMQTLSLSGGTMSRDWAAGLVNGWDTTKSRRSRAVGSVASSAVGVSTLDLTPDQTGGQFPMEANEWIHSVLTFTSGPEDTNSYQIVSNTLLVLRLYGGSGTPAWISGGPAPGDTFVVEDRQSNPPTPPVVDSNWQGARNNSFFDIFRTFKADGAFSGASLAQGKCFDIRVITPIPGGADDQFEVRHVGGKINSAGKIELDSPATLPIGLVNYLSGRDGDVCSTGTAQGVGEGGSQYGDIQADVPVRATLVPKVRRPGVGFHGTAYSFDSDKWDGGGEAGIGDAGVRDILVVDDPSFTSLAFSSEYEAYADALLECFGTLAVAARVRYTDRVEPSWAGLDKRITLSDTETPRTTGYEDSDDLWIMETEWDFEEWSTTVSIGNMVSLGGLDVEASRARFANTARMKQWREMISRLNEMRNCLGDGFQSATAAEITSSQGICATQVSTGRGTSVADELPTFAEVCGAPGGAPASGPCENSCTGGLVSGKATLLANAAVIAGMTPCLIQPDEPVIAGGDPIEDVVACNQDHTAALWTFVHDLTTAAEAAFKSVEDCMVAKESDISHIESRINSNNTALTTFATCIVAAVNAIVTWLNVTQKNCLIAAFGACWPGPGVPYTCTNAPTATCPLTLQNATQLSVCGPVCECQVTPPNVPC